MDIRGILFDFDGTILKSMEQHYEAWQKAFAEKNISITAGDFFPLEGQGIDTIARLFGKKFNLDKSAVNHIIKRKIEIYNDIMHVEFYDYFQDLLGHLKNKNIPVGVVTGGSRRRVKKVIDQYFNGTFDALVTVDDVQRGKPHPDPFLKGAELLGLKPQQCIVIENAPLGIKGAKRAEMTVIAVTTTLPPDELNEAHYIAHDFKEAEAIIESLI